MRLKLNPLLLVVLFVLRRDKEREQVVWCGGSIAASRLIGARVKEWRGNRRQLAELAWLRDRNMSVGFRFLRGVFEMCLYTRAFYFFASFFFIVFVFIQFGFGDYIIDMVANSTQNS